MSEKYFINSFEIINLLIMGNWTIQHLHPWEVPFYFDYMNEGPRAITINVFCSYHVRFERNHTNRLEPMQIEDEFQMASRV